MRRRVLAGIAVLVVVVVTFSLLGAIFFLDLSSYTASGSQTLNPSGPSVGRALVVYDPGLSGAAQKAAQMVAQDLQQKGYVVDLAGVKSSAASNLSGYGIIVAGGPMYFGQATSSIDDFLNGVGPQQNAKLGVFVTTGNSQVVGSDEQMLQRQVASATTHPVSIEMILLGSEDQNCADLVANLTK